MDLGFEENSLPDACEQPYSQANLLMWLFYGGEGV
jgi:hypothetical protein